MIEAMAHAEGFKFAECLTGQSDSSYSLHDTDIAHACTGFKFIGNAALNLEKEGYEEPFGYEEAIGFMFGSEIRDKDGVAATVRRRAVHRRDAHG